MSLPEPLFRETTCKRRSKSAAGGGVKSRHPINTYPARCGVSIVSFWLPVGQASFLLLLSLRRDSASR
jgi:hypothetical protein